jgi:hypothetical protein
LDLSRSGKTGLKASRVDLSASILLNKGSRINSFRSLTGASHACRDWNDRKPGIEKGNYTDGVMARTQVLATRVGALLARSIIMPFFSPKKKDAPIEKAGVFSIKTEVDAIKWFENRKKAFGGTKQEVLQKWNHRTLWLPDLKADVEPTHAPAFYQYPGTERTWVNPEVVKALAKAMQYDPKDKRLSADFIKQMWPTSMILADFGRCLELLVAGTKFCMGPLKGFDRMAEKLEKEYDLEIAQLNDAYRASIVCKDKSCLDQLLAECHMVVTPVYGIAWHKPFKDKFKDSEKNLGYGDFTYYLNFREVDQTAELQIHQLGIIFGKTTFTDWVKMELEKIFPYKSLEGQYHIPGGLGHHFYEIVRGDKASPTEKDKAENLSIRYYDICKGKKKATSEDTKEFRKIAKSLGH